MNAKEREEAMNSAAISADIRFILKAIGKAPVSKNGQLVHPDYDDLVIASPTHWVRLSGRTGRAGQFTEGTALHYMIEYEGMNFKRAREAICQYTASHLLPDQPIVRMNPKERIHMIEKHKQIMQTLTEQKKENPEDTDLPDVDENGEIVEDDGLDASYPKTYPKPSNEPAKWQAAKEYAFQNAGIDPRVMDCLLTRGEAFVWRKYIVYPGPQKDGSPGFFYMQGLFIPNANEIPWRPWKKTLQYSKWAWHAGPPQSSLYIFETPVDAAAYMSILLKSHDDMRQVEQMQVLALSIDKDTPLLTYMQTHDVLKLNLCLNRTPNSPDLEKRIRDRFGGFELETERPMDPYDTWRAQALAQKKQRA